MEALNKLLDTGKSTSKSIFGACTHTSQKRGMPSGETTSAGESFRWVRLNTLGILVPGIYALCDKPSQESLRSTKSISLRKSAKPCLKPVTSCKSSYVGTRTRTNDLRSNEIPEMIAPVDPLNAGFCLTDPGDERYQYITRLKSTFGEFLHRASLALRDQWEENTVDAVQMLVM